MLVVWIDDEHATRVVPVHLEERRGKDVSPLAHVHNTSALEAARAFDVETPAGPNSGLTKADLVRVLGLDGGGEM